MLAVRSKKISRPLVFITAILLILLYAFTAVPSYGQLAPEYPGSITIIKTVLDSYERPVENDDTDFEFEIYYYEGDLLESFTLKNGESLTIDNLPLGMYNICEITDDGRYSPGPNCRTIELTEEEPGVIVEFLNFLIDEPDQYRWTITKKVNVEGSVCRGKVVTFEIKVAYEPYEYEPYLYEFERPLFNSVAPMAIDNSYERYKVVDVLSDGLDFVSAVPPSGTSFDADDMTWYLDNFKPYESYHATLKLKAKAREVGTQWNEATLYMYGSYFIGYNLLALNGNGNGDGYWEEPIDSAYVEFRVRNCPPPSRDGDTPPKEKDEDPKEPADEEIPVEDPGDLLGEEDAAEPPVPKTGVNDHLALLSLLMAGSAAGIYRLVRRKKVIE